MQSRDPIAQPSNQSVRNVTCYASYACDKAELKKQEAHSNISIMVWSSSSIIAQAGQVWYYAYYNLLVVLYNIFCDIATGSNFCVGLIIW